MKIAVLISGGVDSAVVVHKLKEQGHDLTLFYIRIGMDNGEGDCSAEEDIEMCTAIAHKYGLPLEVVSLHQEYWDNVMDYALRTVKAGLTPNPDMMCNKMIKFGFFEQRWGREFDMTATGHYATTDIINGKHYLATAVDPVKDQTDFLAQISYEQLCHLMFPIGAMPKDEVRRIAQEAKLPNAYRKDSQGICFLGKINYNDFIRRHLGEKKGNIIEIETHIAETHFISGNPWEGITTPVDIMFKNRHTPVFMNAKLVPMGDDEYLIESETKVQGIAPGQFAVIYDATGHLCYGSGIITGRKIDKNV